MPMPMPVPMPLIYPAFSEKRDPIVPDAWCLLRAWGEAVREVALMVSRHQAGRDFNISSRHQVTATLAVLSLAIVAGCGSADTTAAERVVMSDATHVARA